MLPHEPLIFIFVVVMVFLYVLVAMLLKMNVRDMCTVKGMVKHITLMVALMSVLMLAVFFLCHHGRSCCHHGRSCK